MDRTAYLLAGGEGTRLKGISKEPKPFIKINDEPYLIILIKWCCLNRFKKIKIIINQDNAELVENCLRNINLLEEFPEISIKILLEKKRMGTGGYLANNLEEFPDQFFIINCDTVYSECISSKINHVESDDYSYLFGYQNSKRNDAGNIQIDKNKFINNFMEKNGQSDIISCGIYFMIKVDIFKILKKFFSYCMLNSYIHT